MSIHSDFQAVDQDGRWTKINHFLLHTHTAEQAPLVHCLADPTQTFLCESIFCNSFLA